MPPKGSTPPQSDDLELESRLLVWYAPHALGASSAQKPLVVVLEKEPDVISLFLVPVTRRNLLLLCLKRSLTLSPLFLVPVPRIHLLVGRRLSLFLGILVPVPCSHLSVGKSLSQSLPVLVHFCNLTAMTLTVGTLTSVSRTLCQTPSTQKRARQLNPLRNSLWSHTVCTPPRRTQP